MIKSYLEGGLSKEDRLGFEKELLKNEELQKKLDDEKIELNLKDLLFIEQARKEINFIEQELENKSLEKEDVPTIKTKSSSILSIFKRAAIFIGFLLVSAAFYANSKFDNHTLVQKFYFQPVNNEIRSESSKPLNIEIEQLVSEEKWAQAALFIEQQKSQDPAQKYLLAHCHFNSNNFKKARTIFEEISSKKNLLGQKAKYDLALVDLKTQENKKAFAILKTIKNQDNHIRNKEASDLLEQLNSGWRRLVF